MAPPPPQSSPLPLPPSPPSSQVERNPTTLVTSKNTISIALHDERTHHHPKNSKNYNLLLAINYACLFIGSVSSTLVSKFYFNHKGNSRWVSTWVQSAGFPLLILPVYLPYYVFKCTKRKPFTCFNRMILVLSILVGVFIGVNNLLFSWGNSYLPVSTSSLVLSSQLAFNLILSAIIVKQKITFVNLNCVILLTLSSLLLGISSSHDRPPGLTHAKYLVGFFSTLGAGLLFALYLPVMESIYRRVYCYAMVVEMQLVMEIAATVFATVGMALDDGFEDMRTESLSVFDKGPAAYWWTIVGNLVLWQFCFLGTAGMVFLTTSLTGGICMTALMAANVVGGALVYREAVSGVKAVAAVMCAWGFCSYLYGMYVMNKKQRESDDHEIEGILEHRGAQSQQNGGVIN